MELWKNFDRLVVFDTETTGIEFGRDRIIEIGAVALENGAERGNFNALVRLPAGQMLPTFITELTGITDEQLDREGVDDRAAAEGFCRLSYAVAMESCMEGLRRIEEFVSELK